MQTEDAAKNILRIQVKEAVASSKEYNRAILRDRLIEVCGMDNNIFMDISGHGFSSRLIAQVDLSENAGDLEDWARGVAFAREYLDVSGKNPIRASNYWKNKIYPNSDWYESMIELRLEGADKIAPYWSLLDQGNIDAEMSSNWGGIAYPKTLGSHFVEKTEDELKGYYNRQLRQAQSDYESFPTKYYQLLPNVESLIEAIEAEIRRINSAGWWDGGYEDTPYGGGPTGGGSSGGDDWSVPEPPSAPPPEDVWAKVYRAEDRVLSHYGMTLETANLGKVSQILHELAVSGQIVNYTVTADGRVEVTEAGTGRRVRLSVNKLRGFLDGD
jgi:hypothetical protein